MPKTETETPHRITNVASEQVLDMSAGVNIQHAATKVTFVILWGVSVSSVYQQNKKLQ